MPRDFDACVAKGGKVRTKPLKGNQYIHLCIKGSKAVAGYPKTKKADKAKGK